MVKVKNQSEDFLPEGTTCITTVFSWQTSKASNGLDSVTGFAFVDKIVVQDDIQTAGHLTRWSILWQFLDRNGLVVLEDTQTEFHFQWIFIFILQNKTFKSVLLLFLSFILLLIFNVSLFC